MLSFSVDRKYGCGHAFYFFNFFFAYSSSYIVRLKVSYIKRENEMLKKINDEQYLSKTNTHPKAFALITNVNVYGSKCVFLFTDLFNISEI